MVRVFVGPNSFALLKELHKIQDEFTENYGDLAIEKIDCDEATQEQIYSAVESVPFLAEKKLVVLRNLGLNKQLSDSLEDLIIKTADSTELIIVESKPDKRSTYYKKISKLDGFQEFGELQENELIDWLVNEAKLKGARLTIADARYLAERSGSSQESLFHELEKLAAYDPSITRQNIDLLVDASPQSTIFNLLDSAFARDTKKVMKIYDQQRAEGNEPLKIMGMLVWQTHQLATVASADKASDEEIMRLSGIKPYSLQKSRSIISRLGTTGIQNLLARLVELDRQIKTTSIDADNALKSLLVTI